MEFDFREVKLRQELVSLVDTHVCHVRAIGKVKQDICKLHVAMDHILTPYCVHAFDHLSHDQTHLRLT